MDRHWSLLSWGKLCKFLWRHVSTSSSEPSSREAWHIAADWCGFDRYSHQDFVKAGNRREQRGAPIRRDIKSRYVPMPQDWHCILSNVENKAADAQFSPECKRGQDCCICSPDDFSWKQTKFYAATICQHILHLTQELTKSPCSSLYKSFIRTQYGTVNI